MTKELTPKQEAFVREYLIDWNGTQAAIRAGYSVKGARTKGSRLLANANVLRVLRAKKKELAERLDLTAEEVLLDAILLKDACMVLDDNGKPKDATNAARMIQVLGNHLELWGQNKKDKPSEGVQFVIEGLYPKEEDVEDDNTSAIQ